jgi:hypothetical protein
MSGPATVQSYGQLVINGQPLEAFGEALIRVKAAGGDVGVLKPFVGDDGRSYVSRWTLNERTGEYEEKVQVANAPALLPLYAWQRFDTVVERAMRLRLAFMNDLRARVTPTNIDNPMGKAVFTSHNAGDMGPATVSMDPKRRGESNKQVINNLNFPLYIVHKDFDFNWRDIEISKSQSAIGINFQLDTEAAESSAYAVAKLIEEIAVGVAGVFTDNGNSVYGMTNMPERSVFSTMTAPNGTNGTTVLNEWLTLRQLLKSHNHHGPYMVYTGLQWDAFLDNEFKTNSDRTLRERLLALPDILGIRTLDTLPATNYPVVFVEMLPRTVRPLIGMEAQTVQWESAGGYERHFKVLAMIYAQFRPDTDGFSGVGHGFSATP